MRRKSQESGEGGGRSLLEIVRGEAGTASRAFEIGVQVLILLSLVTLALETMTVWTEPQLWVIERLDELIVGLFLIEYILRIAAAENKRRYLFSFWGIVDFLAVVPTILLAGLDFKALRALLFLRLVRLLKLGRYHQGVERLIRAFREVLPEFIIFFAASMVLLYLASAGIYFLEREAQPDVFSSIPAAMWWAVATFTTVGYGDIYPVTAGGKIFTGLIVLIGLCLVGIPAGLIAAALVEQPDHKRLDDDGENKAE